MDRASVVLFGVPLRCEPTASGEDLESRPSPYASVPFDVGGRPALLCYGRPFARGRPVFGHLVPFGELWRTGANEPTVLQLPFAAEVAGIRVPRGKYSLYTVPGREKWTLVVNRSVRQWGLTRSERGPKGRLFPSAYNAAVASAELGRAELAREETPHVEQLSIHARVESADTTVLVLEWETTRVRIPVKVAYRRG